MEERCPPLSKLRLKRTSAERAERAHRKAHKAARKASKKHRTSLADGYTSTDSSGSRKARKKKHRRAGDDDYNYNPSHSVHTNVEEDAFMEKMWGALEEDERLDSIDASFRSYTHIPDRWRDDRTGRESHLAQDPQYMDDDGYAEWIREGMWRRKHAREYEEKTRKETERAARRAREAEIRAETARLEKASLERREQKTREKARLREQEYRQHYEAQWKVLLDPHAKYTRQLAYMDIPWPLFPVSLSVHSNAADHPTYEDFTREAISRFLIPSSTKLEPQSPGADERERKEKKEKLKEAMLRFHPDKFEGRIMQRVLHSDRDRVQEAVGQVVRVLNALMGAQSR